METNSIDLRPDQRCIVTVADDGVIESLADCLESITRYGCVGDVPLIVFAIEPSRRFRNLLSHYRANLVKCRAMTPIGPGIKSLMYSAANWVKCSKYLCIDADTIVTSSLRCVFDSLDVLPNGSVLVCRDANSYICNCLEDAFVHFYFGNSLDLNEVFNASDDERRYKLVVNDGVFAAKREPLLAIDATIRSLHYAPDWVDGDASVPWRNQFVFNFALARLDCAVSMNVSFNSQFHSNHAVKCEDGSIVPSLDEIARVLHFSGARGKLVYNKLKKPMRGVK